MEEDDIKDELDAMVLIYLQQLTMCASIPSPDCTEPNNSTNSKKIFVFPR